MDKPWPAYYPINLPVSEKEVRLYCGSYYLVLGPNGKRYRTKEILPGFKKIEGVYDKKGYLLEQYWALPRLIDGREM